jgi:polyisoprenoid-binding protein YceI
MIWDIDPAQVQVSFALSFLWVSTAKGRFKTVRGRFHIDEQHLTQSWVEAEVEAASIDTHNRLRDAHLRSASFFDVKQYPKITFQSTQIEQVSDQTYQVTGNLTLRGVTRPITFEVTHQEEPSDSSARAYLRASAMLNRHDFGVSQGRMVVGALVSIALELEVVQQSSNVQGAAACIHEREKAYSDAQPTAPLP